MADPGNDRNPDASNRDMQWGLLDAVPDGVVVVSGTGEILYANRHAATLFEYKTDELVGMPVDLLLPDELRGVHRAHRTRYRAEPVTRSMGDGLLLQAQRSDGSRFPVEISLNPFRGDGDEVVVASVRDVSHRVAIESHLHRVLVALDASDDGVFMFDADTLRYCYVNRGASRLIGYARDELLEMTPMHLNPNGSAAYYADLVAALEADPARTIVRQKSLMRKDGSDVPVETTYKWAGGDDEGMRWAVALVRDASARLAAQAELAERDAELHRAEQMIAVSEDRERIARDLHDMVVQQIFGVGLNLQATTRLLDLDVNTARERVDAAVDDLDLIIKRIRSAIFALEVRPSEEDAGCRARLLDVARNARRALGFEPALVFDGPVDTHVDNSLCADLVAVMTETVSNAARHGGARNIAVHLAVADDVLLCVEGDGNGPPSADTPRGNGLRNLESRARERGGSFSIEGRAGQGSVVEWRVPLPTP